MTLERDKVSSIAEVLFKALAAGSAVVVGAAAGIPPLPLAVGKELVSGIGSTLISAAKTRTDL